MKSYQKGILRSFTSSKINSKKDRTGRLVHKTKGNLIEGPIKSRSIIEKDSNSKQRLLNGLTSVDEDLLKLENLSNKNLSARFNWLEIEQRLIQLGAKKKLEPIANRYNKRSGSIEIPDRLHVNRRFEARFSIHEI